MYEIIFSNQSKKFIKSLDEKRKSQIKNTIDSLKADPFSIPYKKLVNYESDYRIRVGEFRISYSVYKKELLIKVIKENLDNSELKENFIKKIKRIDKKENYLTKEESEDFDKELEKRIKYH